MVHGKLRRARRWTASVAAVTVAFAGLLAAPAANADAPKVAPNASGKHHSVAVKAAQLTRVQVPGTKPMSTAAANLSKYGYTEREYFATGTAHRYRGATNAATQDASVIDNGWPYRTRVLVRSPRPDHFNGTLIVEWTNVTIGVDADFVFAEAHADLLRQGYAYAVVSAQKVGVDRLKTWSHDRYATLSVDASNTDPQGSGPVDACSGGATTCAGDPLSWDVFAQVAKAVKANKGPDRPLPGLRVKDVIATGQSQSASRLTTYYNAIQPLQHFFDGFLLWDRATAKLRPDVRVPAVSVNSEGLVNLYSPFGTSRYTREWEVAGSTHGSITAEKYVDKMFNRDGSLIGSAGKPISFTQWIEPSCNVLPAFSPVPNGYVIAAGTRAVKRWIEHGTKAPPSIYFTRDAKGQVVRDAAGNIEGGVQLPQFAVPTAEIRALNGTAFPCSVSGSHRDYTPQELKARYGDSGHYVSLVVGAVEQPLKGGYLLPHDAAKTVKQAGKVRIP